ncbi:hypothetical protein [Verminephrobacter eiseniae]|uniref:hypothetical protein n=1 Tax=Verminephrobacter eiseniae TaxID=364317 RepID=UPI0022370E93|nr:hypothetical protein [Verminephrobacter eiseniae]
MDDKILVRVGLSRLRHPLPPVKLMVAHSAAAGIISENGAVVWNALLTFIENQELESEVAEALMVAFLAKKSPLVTVAALHRVIARPSPLSDYILMGITGQPVLINAWSKSHSGEVPKRYTISEYAQSLTAAHLVPPILRTRLAALEKQHDLPFLRQWEYEIECLVCRLGAPSGSDRDYWSKDPDAVALQISHACHFGRSAYLRTLALAFDLWGMSEEIVHEEVKYAIPCDLVYAQILPGECPVWAAGLQEALPDDANKCSTLIGQMVRDCSAGGELLMYLNAPLGISNMYRAELRITSCYVNNESARPKDGFALHDYLLNRMISLTESLVNKIDVKPFGFLPGVFPNNVSMLPGVIPGPMRHFGYLVSDLLSRFSYLPANHSVGKSMTAKPTRGGIDIDADGVHIGHLTYWNQRWQPTHSKGIGTPCGTALTLKEAHLEGFSPNPVFRLQRYWELKIFERDNSHMNWNKRTLYGRVLDSLDTNPVCKL